MTKIKRQSVKVFADVLIAIGRLDMARVQLKTIGLKLPKNVHQNEALRLLRDEGSWANAIEVFARVGERVPPEEFLQAAENALMMRNDVETARKLFELAEREESIAPLVTKVATALLRAGYFDSAVELLGEFRLPPNFPADALKQAAQELAAGGNFDQAMMLCELAVIAELR